MWSAITSVMGALAPALIWILNLLGFKQGQAIDYLNRVSKSQASTPGPNTQDQLDDAQAQIDQKAKDAQKGDPQ